MTRCGRSVMAEGAVVVREFTFFGPAGLTLAATVFSIDICRLRQSVCVGSLCR